MLPYFFNNYKGQNMITVKFFSLIRLLIKQNELILDAQDITIREVLEKAQAEIPLKFIFKLLDSEGQLLHGTIIMINGKNVFHLDKLDSMVKDNDVVSLFPPGGGG